MNIQRRLSVLDEVRPRLRTRGTAAPAATPDSTEVAFMALVQALEARDPGMHGHSERIARYAVSTGRAIGLRGADLEALRLGGYLHDIGKVGVPDAVLLKPGPLTLSEFSIMRRHAEIGDRLCAPLDALSRIRPIVLCHHERIDGSGYPHGLQGAAVPLLAQIVGIVDVYDALTSRRSYRIASSHGVAVRHIVADTEEGRFDTRLVEAFLNCAEHRVSRGH